MLKFDHITHLNEGLPADIYFTSDERISLNREDKIHDKESGKYRLFVATTSHPDVFTFGAIQLKGDNLHKVGYVWSSRAGVINREFDETLVEVCINNASFYSMRVEDLKKYLPDDYKVVKMEKTDGELYYDVVKEGE